MFLFKLWPRLWQKKEKNLWKLLQRNCSGGTKGHTPRFIHKPAVIMCNKVPALPWGRQQRRRRRKVRKMLPDVASLHQTRFLFLRDTLNGAVCAFRQWQCSEHGGSETMIKMSDTRDPGWKRSVETLQTPVCRRAAVARRRFAPFCPFSRIVHAFTACIEHISLVSIVKSNRHLIASVNNSNNKEVKQRRCCNFMWFSDPNTNTACVAILRASKQIAIFMLMHTH